MPINKEKWLQTRRWGCPLGSQHPSVLALLQGHVTSFASICRVLEGHESDLCLQYWSWWWSPSSDHSLVYLLLLLSHFSHVRLYVTHRRQPTRLPRPWDSPGKNTGMGCHFLLQCMKVKSEREVAQSCPTLHGPMDCSLPGSPIHGIFQARVLE